MSNLQKLLAKQILETLSKQTFANWYNLGRFDDYITGELPRVSEDEILSDIVELFNLGK